MGYQYPVFHFHAYQPGDVTGIINIEENLWETPLFRERKAPVSVTVRGKKYSAENWTSAMLRGYLYLNETFREIYSATGFNCASIDIEPWTMLEIARRDKINATCILEDIKHLIYDGVVDFVNTLPFHPILPLLDDFEKKILVKLSFKLADIFLSRWCNISQKIGVYGFWLPEVAYNRRTLQVLYREGNRFLPKNTRLLVLFDNAQAPWLDPRSLYILDPPVLAIFRDHDLSDYIAFSPEATAENIAGRICSLYDSVKEDKHVPYTVFLSMDLESMLYNSEYAGRFYQVLQALKKMGRFVKSPLRFVELKYNSQFYEGEPFYVEPIEDSSWSDYFRPTTLARWTGIYNGKTYIRQYKGRDISQIWKIAFQKLTRKTATTVRENVIYILKEFLSCGEGVSDNTISEIADFLADYGILYFSMLYGPRQQAVEDKRRLLLEKSRDIDICGRVARAYYFMLSGLRSCPAFWENIDTRVTAQNVFFLGLSLTELLTVYDSLISSSEIATYKKIGYKRRMNEILSIFQHDFLNFSGAYARYGLEQYGSPREWQIAIMSEIPFSDLCVVERISAMLTDYLPEKHKLSLSEKQVSGKTSVTGHIEAEQGFYHNKDFCEDLDYNS